MSSIYIFLLVSIDKFLCENGENPLGINIIKPKLSWVLTLLLQLKIAYIGSTFEVLPTDGNWKSPGCLLCGNVRKYHHAIGRFGYFYFKLNP